MRGSRQGGLDGQFVACGALQSVADPLTRIHPKSGSPNARFWLKARTEWTLWTQCGGAATKQSGFGVRVSGSSAGVRTGVRKGDKGMNVDNGDEQRIVLVNLSHLPHLQLIISLSPFLTRVAAWKGKTSYTC